MAGGLQHRVWHGSKKRTAAGIESCVPTDNLNEGKETGGGFCLAVLLSRSKVEECVSAGGGPGFCRSHYTEGEGGYR